MQPDLRKTMLVLVLIAGAAGAKLIPSLGTEFLTVGAVILFIVRTWPHHRKPATGQPDE